MIPSDFHQGYGGGGPIHRQHHALRHGGAAHRGTATGARDQQPTLAEDARGCPGKGDLDGIWRWADGKVNQKPRFTGWDYIIIMLLIPIIVVICGCNTNNSGYNTNNSGYMWL